jgi:ribosomal protein S18 acetylase RimI-like enzyme
MRLEEWREWPADEVAALFERQQVRWARDLGWDAQPLFTLIERARGAGELPGMLAVEEDGSISGWAYASVQDGILFIGALHGDRAEIVRALLDAVLETVEASYARAYRCFIFPDTPAVAAALTRRRFDVQPFLYLSRAIAPGEPEASRGSSDGLTVRLWDLDDLPETARLLARAYAGTAGARCFAPAGRLDEWAAYLAQIARTPACGIWAPDESLACPDEAGERLDAILIATRLSDRTTHVAQVAVDPRRRRHGTAAALVEASARRAAAAGARVQTLLVAESNRPARALYERLGFTPASCFLFAERPRISRVVASPALQAADLAGEASANQVRS